MVFAAWSYVWPFVIAIVIGNGYFIDSALFVSFAARVIFVALGVASAVQRMKDKTYKIYGWDFLIGFSMIFLDLYFYGSIMWHFPLPDFIIWL
jgi:hypothetical protein